MAADLQVPQMLDSIDEWLQMAASQEKILGIERTRSTMTSDEYGRHRSVLVPTDATIQAFTHFMTLSRSFALPRFSKMVDTRLGCLPPDDKVSVLAAEVQHVHAELAKLRPAPSNPLRCE